VNQVRAFKASIFQALGHPTRLQIMEVLRDGEMSVNAIQSGLGRDQANISQHLTSLRLRGLVVSRKAGNQVFYSVRDPLLFEVLDLMRRFSAVHLRDHLEMLRQLKGELE
jgi:DNA-binding transcriptional ArsR family regulator